MNGSPHISARPLSTVPLPVLAVLIASLVIQVCWSYAQPRAAATAESLPDAPDTGLLRLHSLGEPDTLAKILMLWLQAFDNQPGVSIPFARLDYARVINWLDALLDLDSRFQYPLLSASRVYTQTPNDAGKRQMLEFVHRRFLEDPDRRWPWMAHGVYVAKHRIKDLQLALKYAYALRLNVSSDTAPPWATQMEIFVLEDLGEIESARIIIGGLLASGRLAGNDNELQFLKSKLAELQQGNNRLPAGIGG
ncbi:MAG: hypothetical protein OXG54_10645 [Gammaproteobacteria bacterium]|nr:hypothetical protein [Gammaproteobacteria bacterium]